MICRSCGNEVSGIKLNGKLFCPLCGVPLETETPKEAVVPDEPIIGTPPAAKIINSEGEVMNDVDLLDAELEVLELIEEQKNETQPTELESEKAPEPVLSKVPASKIKIEKSDRSRVGFRVPAQPEITEPPKEEPPLVAEESAPEVTQPVETEYPEPKKISPFLEKEEIQKIESKKADQKNLFNNYLKTNLSGITKTQKPKRKRKKLKSKYLVTSLIAFFVLAITISFGLWLSVYYFNPENTLKRAEQNSGITTKVPGYLPGEYSLSGDTTGKKGELTVSYQIPETEREIKITYAKIEPGTVFKYFVGNEGASYTVWDEGGKSFWIIGEDRVLLENDEIGIEIESNSLGVDELVKIAEGLAE